MPEPAYIDISRRKQADRARLLPSQWSVPSELLPKDPPKLEYGPQKVVDVPRKLLSKKEVEITESYTVPTILKAIAERKLSVVEVTEAFCHRTAVAQHLTNCVTEVLFERARKRAEYLDGYMKDNGATIGPLHGLVISVKDTFHIEGVDSSIGLASLCYKPAKRNAPLVDLLESLGCVIIAKTNIPQTLASLDSVNNVWGRSMNPVNRMMTAGGSSGGEGVMVAMKAVMVGIGTDVGGSIRVPAYVNGVVGFKPSEGRVPYGGQQGTGLDGGSAVGVQAVAGPISRNVEDGNIVMREIMRVNNLFAEDCIPGAFSHSNMNGSGEKGELVIGVLRSDGNCSLHPPIDKILTEVADMLSKSPGVKVTEVVTPEPWQKSQGAMSKLMGVGGSENLNDLITSTGEPLVPWMKTRFRKGPPQAYARMAELKAQRAALQQEMIDVVWTRTDDAGRRRRKVDALICPLAAHPVPEIERYNAVGYTSSWVYLDCPAGNLPIRDMQESDLELGKPQGGKVLSSWDEKNRELWDESKTDRKVYLGTQLSVQIVVPKLEEGRLAQVLSLVEGVTKQGSMKPKL